jgi:hypothetical protein
MGSVIAHFDPADLAPVDYTVFEFRQCEDFPREAVREILALESAEIIRIVDALVIRREQGEFEEIELRALPATHPLAPIADRCLAVLADDDIERLASTLSTQSCALVLVYEQRWARELAAELTDAGARCPDRGPIDHDVLVDSLRATERSPVLTPRRRGRRPVVTTRRHRPPDSA